jgi:hypothetical protein
MPGILGGSISGTENLEESETPLHQFIWNAQGVSAQRFLDVWLPVGCHSDDT